jgi:HEAT repeat protein
MNPLPHGPRLDDVKDYLRGQFRFENIKNFVRGIPSFTLRLIEYGLDTVVPALADLLDDPDAFVRIYAALWLRITRKNSPRHVRPEHERRAVRVLIDALSGRAIEQKIMTMSILTAKEIGSTKAPSFPREAIPILANLLKHEDARLRVMAAIVLLPHNPERKMGRVIQILESALVCDDVNLSSLAAQAFGSMKLRRKKSVRIMLRRLVQVRPECQLSFILALVSMGTFAIPAVPALIAHFRSPTCHVAVKAAIIRGIGTIIGAPDTKDRKRRDALRAKTRAIMFEAMKSGDWPVVWAAADGLRYTGGFPAEAVALLIPMLRHEASEVRGMAAQSLSELSPVPDAAILVLIERLQVEDRDDVAVMVVAALAAVGVAALPELLALLTRGDAKLISRITEVFVRSGSDSAHRLACELLAHPDEFARLYCIAILQRMGPRGLPALPIAIRLLNHSEALVRQHGAMAVCFMGPNAKEAVPRLIELLNDPNIETAFWAEKAISFIGASSVPALREAYGHRESSSSGKIAELLHYFGSSPTEPGSDGFEWMEDDDTLILFAWIGLRLRKKVESITQLSKELQRLLQRGAWIHTLPIDRSSIRTRLESFKNKVNRRRKTNIKLMHDSKGNRKPRNLTGEGELLLEQVITYLRKKGVLVIPGQEATANNPSNG